MVGFGAISVDGTERRLELSADVVAMRVGGILEVRDGTIPAFAATARMHVAPHVGYFVDVVLASTRRSAHRIFFDRVESEQNVFGFAGVGPFFRLWMDAWSVDYRIGLGIASDGAYHKSAITQGITVTRRLYRRWYARLDVRHVVPTTATIGGGLAFAI